MNRTTLLQDRRMSKFEDLLRRWDSGELSGSEAGELLGCSERQFRRYRRRYEEDGLEGLVAHNLITFKSHHEALNDWAMKELVGHYVAYRKLVSASPSELLPEEAFRLYAVCARFPQNLSGQVPWQEEQVGV